MNELSMLCFVSVANTHSFSTTARELMITQQAVSRCIQSLEEEMGFPLLLRSHRSAELTVAGQHLLRFLMETERQRAFLDQRCRGQAWTLSLRVGISTWLGRQTWFREGMRAFAKARPELCLNCLELSPGEIRELAAGGGLDCLVSSCYAVSLLATPHRTKPLGAFPLALQCSAEDGKRLEKDLREALSHMVHFAVPAGEADPRQMELRDMRIYAELGLCPQRIEHLENDISAVLNSRNGRGVSFCVAEDGATLPQGLAQVPLAREVGLAFTLFHTGMEGDAEALASVLSGEVSA